MSAWFEEEDVTPVKDRAQAEQDAWDDMEPRQLVRHVEEDVAGLAALAREVPRDADKLRKSARAIGARLGAILDAKGEGTRAYYKWHAKNKDGTKSVIQGPTIDLMREIAGEWGGLICKVERIDQQGQNITLRGRVLDVARILAFQRDYEGWLRPPPSSFQGEEAGRWKTMQLQAAESKALRGVLEDIVPSWLVEEALEAARDAAAETRLGGKSLAEGVRKSIEALGKVGLTDVEQLTRWVGRPPGQWTALDLGALRDLYARAKRGELPPDALRVEAAQREAARREEEGDDDGTSAGTGGRLDGLGLGKAPQGQQQQQQPAGAQGQGNGNGQGQGGRDAGASPAAGGGGAAPTEPAAGQPAPEVIELLAKIDALEKTHGKRAREALGMQKIGQRTPVEKLRMLHGELAALDARTKASASQSPSQSPVNGPIVLPELWMGPEGQELSVEIGNLADKVGEEALDRALARAAAGDQPDENGRRRILLALRAEEAALKAEASRAESQS